MCYYCDLDDGIYRGIGTHHHDQKPTKLANLGNKDEKKERQDNLTNIVGISIYFIQSWIGDVVYL